MDIDLCDAEKQLYSLNRVFHGPLSESLAKTFSLSVVPSTQGVQCSSGLRGKAGGYQR